MLVLTVNPGSSSLKVRTVDADGAVVASLDATPDGRELGDFLARHPRPDAVACRVVHGGPRFREPVLVDASVRAALAEVSELAPLHNPVALRALDQVERLLPGVPQVACFDTAFHASLPEAAWRWALPPAWSALGIRRYGFHGFAHRFASRRAAELLGRDVEQLQLVTCHLGAGSSLCAIAHGASVDTTMGFTPADGLVMASRAGAVDPGAIAYAMGRLGLSGPEAAMALERRGGLVALTGTRDMRAVEAAAEAGSERAVKALAVYDHQLRRHLGAMVAVLGGLDALVFSGGVGEGSSRTRAQACQALGFTGLVVDAERNAPDGRCSHDRVISADGSPVAAVVVHAREELEIAAAARRVLEASG